MHDYPDRLNEFFLRRAVATSTAAGVIVTLVGALVLAGWEFDVAVLKGLYGGITMKPNAAVAFVLVGGSLLLLHGPAAPWRRRVGQVSAAVAGLLGAATLSQHLIGWDLGIDQLLFHEPPGAAATASPGRMGPPASTCFILAGLALVALHRRWPARISQFSALGIGLIALLPITGYAYGASALYGIARYTGIALHTAITLLLLSVGLLASAADRGVVAIVAGTGAGSMMARRLLLIGLGVPLLLGWIRVQLENAGYFDPRFGVAALVLATVVVLTTLIATTARRLNRLDEGRNAAEMQLRDRLREFEAIMEVLPVGVFLAKGRPAADIVGNRAAREFLRLPDPGSNLSLSAPQDEAPRHFTVYRDGVELPPDELPVQVAARDGVAVHDLELDVVFEDGVVKHEIISALPLLDDNGEPRGAVASVMDITARRAAEREREQLLIRAELAREEAESANRAKDEFLATISHELRTPLSAIVAWSCMLREEPGLDEKTTATALATIERNAKAQSQLIEDLLDISRIVVGKLRLEMEPTDISGVIGAAVEIVRPAAEARGISLQTQMHGGACMVRCDAARLQQVVWNLLTNAVKFTPRGGTVTAQLSTMESDAMIVVSDTGEGIPAEFMPYLFDRFSQSDGSKTRRHGGLGIGLSIARHLVEMHGGTIQASSAGPGQGATFTVRLPLVVEPPVAGPPISLPLQAPTSGSLTG